MNQFGLHNQKSRQRDYFLAACREETKKQKRNDTKKFYVTFCFLDFFL